MRAESSVRVYPRACGGTLLAPQANLSEKGLSPRVRGNRIWRLERDADAGSIPARAGEPFSILPSSGKPSARVGYRDTSNRVFYSLKAYRARPPCAE